MKINLLEPNKAEELRSKLKNIWDINRPYWYPLFDCDRQDVIAFDYVDYIYDNCEKLENIRFLLRKHGVKNVYEFQEDGTSNEIIDFLDDEIWCSEPYLGGSECFFFDDKMDWIIYESHEGSITFGGEWLVTELKSIWSDWKDNMGWDKKNK